jgi:hypothetical protein
MPPWRHPVEPTATAGAEEPAERSVSPFRLLATAVVLVGVAYAAFQYAKPEPPPGEGPMTAAEAEALNFLVGGRGGETPEQKRESQKKAANMAIRRSEELRQAEEDRKALNELHKYELDRRYQPPPPGTVYAPGPHGGLQPVR